MRQRGKSLTFEEEEIEELVSMKYGDNRVFLLLALLYPFVDLKNQFHIDHVFPRSQFKSANLKKADLDEDQMVILQELRDKLPNLQLLDGSENIQKQATLPMEWLKCKYPASTGDGDMNNAIKNYCDRHDLGKLPEEISDFQVFYDSRYAALKNRVTSLINDIGKLR